MERDIQKAMSSKLKALENVVPALVIPDHFFCNQSTKVVVVYDDPIGEEDDMVTLMFPGDISGSPSKRVVPERIGSRTLVFDTPVYSSCRGLVEVLPLLNLTSGEVGKLAHFKLSLKHPIRNVMELCLSLSTNNAILPVLLSLMVHSQGDNSKKHFQDPHIDRVMATLVGSRTPGDSTCIQDIILPNKKWRRFSLAEFARQFHLTEMEKQAYMLSKVHQRSKLTSKAKNSPKRSETILHKQNTVNVAHDTEDEEDIAGERLHQHLSNSTPDIHTVHQYDQCNNGGSDETGVVQKLIKSAMSVCRVIKDFTPSHDAPSTIPLRVGQEVHVVQETNPDWWYGVCDDRCGYFPPSHIKKIIRAGKIRGATVSESPQHLMRSKQHGEKPSDSIGELSLSRMNYVNFSPSHDKSRTESERSDSSQPESPSLRSIKDSPSRLLSELSLKRKGGMDNLPGFQSAEESQSHTTQKKSSRPFTKQQLLHTKMTPLLPSSSQRPYLSHRHHSNTSSSQPGSPYHGDSANSASDESTNMDSSESDDYEDVISDDDEETVVKSVWTASKETRIKAVSRNASLLERDVHKSFAHSSMQKKILPSLPQPPQQDWGAASHKGKPNNTNYDDLNMDTPDYMNVAKDAFEIVDDHIYDCAHGISDTKSSSSIIYDMTATIAHVKAATQMALTHSQKQSTQVDTQTFDDNLSGHKGRRQHHSAFDTPDHNQAAVEEKVAMSPRTIAAFIPPRNLPRTNISPAHHSSSTHVISGIQPKQIQPDFHPRSIVEPEQHESPALPLKTFAFPTSPPRVPDRTPTLPSKASKVAPTPPPKAPKSVTSPKSKSIISPKRVLPMLPPKEGPTPPPRMLNPTPEPPPRMLNLTPEPPPRMLNLTPEPPPKLSNQSNPPSVHPKPFKQPPTVPIPPPKPPKQESQVPLLPPKAGNSHTYPSCDSHDNENNRHSYGGKHQNANVSLGMFLAAAQQGNQVSKRYYKTS